MTANNEEHRASKRYGVKGLTVQYKPDSIFNLFSGSSTKYVVLDISKTGLQFITREKFKEGAHLQLNLGAPRMKDKIIHAKGHVVWVKDASELHIYVVGVEFSSIEKVDSDKLKFVLDNALMDKVRISDSVHLHKADKL